MKKTMFFALLIMAIAVTSLYAVDWSQYESGRNNIRLDGYQSQPGYIAFTGGDGVVRGYLYMNAQGELMYIPRVVNGAVTSGAFDLTTTKIENQGYHP